LYALQRSAACQDSSAAPGELEQDNTRSAGMSGAATTRPLQQRLAAEVYYATPGHIYAFSPQHPQGAEVLRLSAADGVVESWLTHEKTLWLATQDFRDRKHIKSHASLDLGKLFLATF
jgi:hypothetical protein